MEAFNSRVIPATNHGKGKIDAAPEKKVPFFTIAWQTLQFLPSSFQGENAKRAAAVIWRLSSQSSKGSPLSFSDLEPLFFPPSLVDFSVFFRPFYALHVYKLGRKRTRTILCLYFFFTIPIRSDLESGLQLAAILLELRRAPERTKSTEGILGDETWSSEVYEVASRNGFWDFHDLDS